MTQIYLTTLNLTDSAATFSVDGVRYEYFFNHRDVLRRVDFIAQHSGKRALNFAKRRAARWQRLEDVR